MENAMNNDAKKFAALKDQNGRNSMHVPPHIDRPEIETQSEAARSYVEFLSRYTKHLEETLMKNKAFNEEMKRFCDSLPNKAQDANSN
jgi:hypothetical protein